MFEPITKEPLDAALTEIDRRWKESGIPGLYDGGDGPVSRERARNIRALLYPKPKLPQGSIERLSIAGPGGELAMRIIRPVSGEVTGTLVYFHGGGWVVGDLDSHEAHAIRLANRAGVVVLNVDYRLAPEHKFPAAVEDSEAAVAWAHQHLERLGGVDKPLAVGGDSAGGNLAAAVALYCRDKGISLSAQLLIYAATNLSGKGGPELDYLGPNAATIGRTDPRASPAVAASLAGLAPAIIGVGPHDFLYEDNMAYVKLLLAAKVPVLLRQYPTLNHGFFSYTAISAASEAAANQLCDDLRLHLRAR
jgi:acetyl esterase/lipase